MTIIKLIVISNQNIVQTIIVNALQPYIVIQLNQ